MKKDANSVTAAINTHEYNYQLMYKIRQRQLTKILE